MEKIKTLLLTGEDCHDWRRSVPFCKNLLERSGKFLVTITTTPSSTLESRQSIKDYKLFFLSYNGSEWSEKTKANFETAIRTGAGLVVLHAADNAFPGWVEYEKMVGLLFREESGHGEFHEFRVQIVDHDHPITQGLSDFMIWDELYHRLVRMHRVHYRVLATAFSDPARGGTGNDEPVMIITGYGYGRVYHLVLGHVWPGDPNGPYKGASMVAFENKSLQEVLIRGCEWVATGKVS